MFHRAAMSLYVFTRSKEMSLFLRASVVARLFRSRHHCNIELKKLMLSYSTVSTTSASLPVGEGVIGDGDDAIPFEVALSLQDM